MYKNNELCEFWTIRDQKRAATASWLSRFRPLGKEHMHFSSTLTGKDDVFTDQKYDVLCMYIVSNLQCKCI